MKFYIVDYDATSLVAWRTAAADEPIVIVESQTLDNTVHTQDSPSVVIVDRSPLGDGYRDKVHRLCAERPHQAVVVTGAQFGVVDAVELMRCGVTWVFEKPLSVTKIVRSLPGILQASQAAATNVNEYKGLKALFDDLSSRECDVLDCVLEGIPNKETAARLNVSIRTVESRRAKVYRKLQAKCVAELVRKFDRLALLKRVFESNEANQSSSGDVQV
ncbi:MAG: hypothetical protein KDB03_04370 [Planctomycetales bacterium]|nr:hypothetical protein [Planctomycetales bacterium]